MRRRILQFLLLAVTGTVLPAQAQFWLKKDFRQWSKAECQKLLEDSPWASSYTIGTVVFETVQQESAIPGREASVRVIYLAQFWSARPIRQAIVRSSQLDPKHEKLPAEQREALEERQAKFMETEFPDTVVVQLIYSASSPEYQSQLARYWQSQSPDSLKLSVNLIGAVGRVAPLHVAIGSGAGGEIQFIFPRRFNGRLLAGAKDKDLALELAHPALGLLPSERVFIRFAVKKMVINGEAVF